MMVAFGPGSPYDRTESQSYSKGMKDKSMYPIKGKWRTFVLNRFVKYFPTGETLESYLNNEDDANLDPDNIIRLLPLVALYAGRHEMLQLAEEAALQLQVNDMNITIILAACRIMESFILHTDLSIEDHLKAVIADLKSSSRLHPQPLDRAVAGHLLTALDYSAKLDVQSATMKFGKAWGIETMNGIIMYNYGRGRELFWTFANVLVTGKHGIVQWLENTGGMV